MRDNAATARATRADEYESRFLRPVESPLDEPPLRRREPRPRAYGNREHAAPGPAALRLSSGVPGRRPVQTTGQAAPPRRRSTSSAAMIARPDRTAMWAFLLSLLLVLMTVGLGHAAF